MKNILGVLAMLLPLLSGAQSPPVKALTIGDAVPDIAITNVYNYPASTIHLSDLKGKLVILDFWSTWCGACMESFPKMEKLQKEFGDQLQIILVNTYPGDSIQRVKPFFEKRKARTGLAVTLPFSLLQSPLAEYFPYKFIPHYVWIDKESKVVAITSQLEVTSQNVKNVIEGNAYSLHTKNDFIDFSIDVPLFVNNNGGNGNDFLCRSIFTKYIEGLGNASGMRRNKDGRITRFYMFNSSPLMLLRIAYPGKLIYPSNRTIIEAKNEWIYQPYATSGIMLYKNAYCYELIIPPSTIEEFQNYMREDMHRYLGVKVNMEYRKIKCLVLRKKDSLNGITPGEKPVSALIELLNRLPALNAIPILDEAHISGNIDLKLPPDLHNLSIASLKSFLRKKGFEVDQEEREIKVSVITDK